MANHTPDISNQEGDKHRNLFGIERKSFVYCNTLDLALHMPIITSHLRFNCY